MNEAGPAPADKARDGFLVCLSRPPTKDELSKTLELYRNAKERFVSEPDKAKNMATKPIGAAPEGADVAELAAWTLVGNVLLNLDETLMKR